MLTIFSKFFRKIFGSRNDRLVKKMRLVVAQINQLEAEFQGLSDEQLVAKTEQFKKRLEQGETLESIKPEAFATVREASSRVLGMRHFDVQMIGAMVLDQGKIAEMRTGEGKTLVATLAAYLNALEGKGVHVVTVNDYLARRDAEWMGRLYHFLGMTTGIINSSSGGGPDQGSFVFDLTHPGAEGDYRHLKSSTRKAAYDCDITYGTNNEFGFDYLRDNMAFHADERVQRRHYAIIDEVDSILIDEARTPLIISGPADDSSELYIKMNTIIPSLTRQEPITDEEGKPDFGPGDYGVDEKARSVQLSDAGFEKVEGMLTEMGILGEDESLYDSSNIMLMHHVNAALRAHALFQKNVDYILRDNQIVIVDEFTGRTMPGRRWSEGLHQAVEAKEGVPIQAENQTMASITFQNFFRLYQKLSGMTGTADTEAYEFQHIYGLEVVVMPTNKAMIREDQTDLIFLTQEEKFKAIIEDVKECIERQQPVLVGTASIEDSERVSLLLNQAKVEHKVLNAKQHEQEAGIVAQAGKPGAVTIATNMAGRGTDIVLGGNLSVELEALGDAANDAEIAKVKDRWKLQHQQVLESGGLRVISTERNESRRVDNQLRGRSGRQGDPGSSRFYLSLEDNLMRIFASERVGGLMKKLGMEEGEAIEHVWVNRAIENAQRKVEGRNFDIRKQLLEYDDVANDQRKVVYQQRDELMDTDDVSETIATIIDDVVTGVINLYIAPGSIDEQWDIEGLTTALKEEFSYDLPLQEWLDKDDSVHEEMIRERILDEIKQKYAEVEQKAGTEAIRHYEKGVMLQVLDTHWKEHLAAMDYLRQGIHLRGYAQKDPKQEYKREAFEMFTHMLDEIKHEVVTILLKIEVQDPEEIEKEYIGASSDDFQFQHEEFTGLDKTAEQLAEADKATVETEKPFVRADRKVGRNEPCPCGSGKKYKQCHGKLS